MTNPSHSSVSFIAADEPPSGCRTPQRQPRVNRNVLFCAVLWICILRPFPNVLVGSAFGIARVLDLLTVAIAVFFLAGRFSLEGKVSYPRGIGLPAVVFLVLSTSLPLAYWNSVVVHGEPTGIRDVFELTRFPIMLVMILFLAQVRVDSTNLRQVVRKAFITPYWIVVLLCLADIVTIPVLSEAKRVLWEQSKNSIDFSYDRFRISGTLENPNWFSLYLNMMLALFLFFEKRTLVSLAGAVTCVGLIAMTGSRTGMIGMLLTTLVYSLMSFLKVARQPLRGSMRLAVVAGLIVAGVYLIGSVGNLRIIQSIALIRAKGILGVESANIRASQVRSLVGKYADEPRLLGFGPSKYSVADVIDNQYAEYLVRYGIVGLSLMVLIHFYYGSAALLLWRRCREQPVRDYSLFVCMLAVLMLVYFATGQFGDILRLSLIYLGFIMPVFSLGQDWGRIRRQFHAPGVLPPVPCAGQQSIPAGEGDMPLDAVRR